MGECVKSAGRWMRGCVRVLVACASHTWKRPSWYILAAPMWQVVQKRAEPPAHVNAACWQQ